MAIWRGCRILLSCGRSQNRPGHLDCRHPLMILRRGVLQQTRVHPKQRRWECRVVCYPRQWQRLGRKATHSLPLCSVLHCRPVLLSVGSEGQEHQKLGQLCCKPRRLLFQTPYLKRALYPTSAPTVERRLNPATASVLTVATSCKVVAGPDPLVPTGTLQSQAVNAVVSFLVLHPVLCRAAVWRPHLWPLHQRQTCSAAYDAFGTSRHTVQMLS